MKRVVLMCAVASSAFVIGCGKGGGTTSETTAAATDSRPKARLGNPSPEGALEEAKTPKERAALIHKWMEMKLAPSLYKGAVQKYVNDPDPDLAAAAKEASEQQ